MELTFKAGDVLIKQGDTGHEFYVLNSGLVGIFRSGKKLTEFNKTGSTIGELSGILLKPRTATVMALTDVTVTKMEGDIKTLVRTDPDFAALIVLNLAERLEKTTSQLTEFSEVFEINTPLRR